MTSTASRQGHCCGSSPRCRICHFWLGAKFDQKKFQLSRSSTILCVTYNLEQMQLEIKAGRREELVQEIDMILESGLLDPGSAGKLWGKVGCSFRRVISHRQYMRFPVGSDFLADPPLRESLIQWKRLVSEGPPRPIDRVGSKKVDAVIFTDGFTPDPRSDGRLPDRVGAVNFDRRMRRPRQFTALIPPL